MPRALYLTALLITAVAVPTAAQEPKTEAQRCMDGARTQSAMTECAVDDRVRADRELNRAYQALLPTLEPEQRELLRTAQRAWIAFRDAHCAFERAEFEDGSMAPTIESLCVAELTRTRTRELGPRS